MKGLRAVFFDFDGTLADGFSAITSSVNHVRQTVGLPLLTEPEVRRHVGHGLDTLLEKMIPGHDPEWAISIYRPHYAETMIAGTTLLPGAATAVHALAARGLRLGVCSNKHSPYTARLLESLGLSPPIELVLGPDRVARRKPAPDMLLAALATFGIGADEALYIGDMSVDVQTARAAGVPVWIVPTGTEDHATVAALGPERMLASLHDLLELVGS